jgi:hypothetical protein
MRYYLFLFALLLLLPQTSAFFYEGRIVYNNTCESAIDQDTNTVLNVPYNNLVIFNSTHTGTNQNITFTYSTSTMIDSQLFLTIYKNSVSESNLISYGTCNLYSETPTTTSCYLNLENGMTAGDEILYRLHCLGDPCTIYNISSNSIFYAENSQTYNSTTYETSRETFVLNVTYDSDLYTATGTLYYDGTGYLGTRTGTYNSAFTKSLDIPTVNSITNKTFYWTIALTNSSGTIYYNTSQINQTVYPIEFGKCNATLNTPYINFTFKDEATDGTINAATDLSTWSYYFGSGTVTKTLLFTNSTPNWNYPFCFTPKDRQVNYAVTYQYSNTSYPQRQYTTTGVLTNSTTQQILYLLGTGTGIYTSFQVISPVGSPLQGVSVVVERQLSGIWTQVAQSTSDSAGSVTFWLNPNYDHRVTATKTGYSATVNTIRPTQSVYTIVMGSGGNNNTYENLIEGIYFTKTPASGLLNPGLTTFTYNISAMNSNMVGCKFEIVNSTGYILASDTQACTSNAYLSTTYLVVEGDNIYGRYYVDLGNGYLLLEGDGNWRSITINQTGNSLWDMFKYLSNSSIWITNNDPVEYQKYEYTKFVLFFLLLAILAAVANNFSNFDLNNPGIFLFALPIVITLLSLPGGLTGQGYFYMSGATSFNFLDNWILALYSWMLAISMYFVTIRRDG